MGLTGYVKLFWDIASKHLEATKGIVNLISERVLGVRMMFDKGFDLIPQWFDTIKVRGIRR